MKSLVIVILLLILLMIWILMTRKNLVAVDENVNLAMGQLGVQVSSQFDAAMLLVDLVEHIQRKTAAAEENDSDRISDPYSQINAFGCVETGACDPEGPG